MTDNQSNANKTSFGHERLCKHLAERIDRQFEKPKRNIEPSLVIGLFGEWGSGKSHLLNLIEDHYQSENNKDKITIPVTFNAWRFEKEEHLIVPLMKTTELALKNYVEKNSSWLSKLAKGTCKAITEMIDETSRLCAVSAIAFLSSLKTKASLPGLVSAEIDGDKAVKAFQFYEKKKIEDDEKAPEEANKEAQIFDELSSLYFNFHQNLKKAIGHDKSDGSKINLLFLIDDIDRCLPEKAVEMLESIKLFLDVEGCAFVLGVDDEVVERGIVHRYKDYIFQQQNHSVEESNNKPEISPPITGAEYLEKIIHLPFRLPLPTENEIRQFLLSEFDDLFVSQRTEKESTDENNLEQVTYSEQKITTNETALLDLFVRAVPRVPRKLIRAVELFQLQRDIMQDRGMPSLDELTLARLVILQLLVPDLYRFGRQWQGFLGTLERWEREYKNRWLLDSMKLEDEEKKKSKEDFNEYIFESQDKPLLRLAKLNSNPRSGFDLRNLIDIKHPSDTRIANYYCLLDESKKRHSGIGTGTVGLKEFERSLLQLEDESQFIELISSKRQDAWTSAAGLAGIESGMMSDELFSIFAKSLGAPLDIGSPYIQADWLKIVKPLLDKNQQKKLWNDLPDKLEKKILDGRVSPENRLMAGNCVDALGDSRTGVGLTTEGLPDIDWVDIQAGDFLYGDEKEKQTLDTFKISKFLVTNRQFQSFLEAEDFDHETWWKGIEKQESKSSRFSQGNRPRETVSWYQAIAFTRWLSEKLGKQIQLPTEQQWEKAARGTDGREYPWGNEFKADYLNNHNGSLGETSCVGMYLKGESPYGVLDMSGNVWEWCLGKYDDPDDLKVNMSNDTRVVRGGSFFDNAGNVRCAIRDRLHPVNRGDSIGFRVVCLD